LLLNANRVNFRAAVNHLNAIAYAKGGQLPFELFDAIAFSEEEAEILQEEANIRRAVSEAVAQSMGR